MSTTTTRAGVEPAEDLRTVAELEEAARDGEEITAEQLRAARDRDTLARLGAERDERATRKRAEAERAAAVAQLVADVDAVAAQTVDFEPLAEAIRQAVAGYLAEVDRHNTEIRGLSRRAQALDLDDAAWSAGAPVAKLPYGTGLLRTRGGAVIGEHTATEAIKAAEAAVAEHTAAAQRAQREAHQAANPPIPMRYLRAPNGIAISYPADRPLPSWAERALATGELTEVTDGGDAA